MATVTNVTVDDVRDAIAQINADLYNGNIVPKRLEALSATRVRVTLTVRDSRAEGSRISDSGRRVSAACWHVHGNLYDAILDKVPSAVIRPYGGRIDCNGGNWQDWNAGSEYAPRAMSTLCDCEPDGTPRNMREVESGHLWQYARFTGTKTCQRCGLLPLDSDDTELACV